MLDADTDTGPDSADCGGGPSDPPPRRRIVLSLTLGADSWDEADRALDDVALRLYEAARDGDTSVVCTSGSPSAGWHLEASEDVGVDHAGFVEALDVWLDRQRATP
jgi:hypothetical protein